MTIVALCVRAQAAALAVIRGEQVVEVQRCFLHHFRSRGTRLAAISAAMHGLVQDYRVDAIVMEEGCALAGSAAHVRSLHQMSLRTVLGAMTGKQRSYAKAFAIVLAKHPKLRNLVTTLSGQNGIALTERRRNVSLLAVALGLAMQGRNTKASVEQIN